MISSKKQRTNVSIDSELLQRARQQWLEENRYAISAYNEEIAERGTFSDNLRSF